MQTICTLLQTDNHTNIPSLNFYRPDALPDTHTHTHTFNGPLSGTTQVSRYQKGKTNLDFTGARDSERQWHQLEHMQVCTSLQTDNHIGNSLLKFFTGRMPFLPPNQQCQSTEGNRKGIQWWVAGVVICLERGADLHMAQLMPLSLTVSCFSKIQIGFTFLVPAHPGSPGKGPLNGCVCVC